MARQLPPEEVSVEQRRVVEALKSLIKEGFVTLKDAAEVSYSPSSIPGKDNFNINIPIPDSWQPPKPNLAPPPPTGTAEGKKGK